MKRIQLVLLLLVIGACADERQPGCEAGAHGFLIENVILIDGTGAPRRATSVRVSNGLIAGIGELAACDDEAVIDGRGQVLTPGFIDTHSHVDEDLFAFPDALPMVSQGITTSVVGQDGSAPYPLADFYARLEDQPASINVAAYAGHNTIRKEVLGDEFKRISTRNEVNRMAKLLQRELDSGAIGLSTGLEYEPGIYSDTAEVLELARVTAAAGGRYISHVRSEDRWFEDAVDEAILVGRETGMPVQISHIKLAMTRLLGTADQLLAKLNAARAAGIDISADIYPYEYWQSTMMVLLPNRDYTDRDTIAEALNEISPPEGLWFSKFDPNPDYVGRTLAEIAALREVDAVTAFSQLAAEAKQMEVETGNTAEAVIGTSMQEADISALLLWPHTNICTDGGIVDLHPRKAGTFPRVLGRYVREQELLSLEEAVYKMTGLAASHMGFVDRGEIREGMVADLVLFDPDTVLDLASPTEPDTLSRGILSVWVAGELTFSNGNTTDARAGKVIRSRPN